MDGFQREDDAPGLLFVEVELEEGEVVIELCRVELAPVDEVEVFLGFEKGEDLDAEGGEDEVGVPGAAHREAEDEAGEEEKGQGHPPMEIGMPHQGGDRDEESESEGDGGGDEEALSLGGTGEAEFLVGLGDVLWGSHFRVGCRGC